MFKIKKIKFNLYIFILLNEIIYIFLLRISHFLFQNLQVFHLKIYDFHCAYHATFENGRIFTFIS